MRRLSSLRDRLDQGGRVTLGCRVARRFVQGGQFAHAPLDPDLVIAQGFLGPAAAAALPVMLAEVRRLAAAP